jgi:two-component system response regulator CpxR
MPNYLSPAGSLSPEDRDRPLHSRSGARKPSRSLGEHCSRDADVAPVRSILLIDDDLQMNEFLSRFFPEHGYTVDVEVSGRDGLRRALVEKHDLVILSVVLPFLEGFEVLRQIRRRSQSPPILLTGRTNPQDRIAGLEAGADDYLSKPFDTRELLARVRAVLRRAGYSMPAQDAIIAVGSLRLNAASREIWRGPKLIATTSIEFDLLELLMRSAGRVVSRERISAILYHREISADERGIDVHVSHLRKKLGPIDRPIIRAIRGVGYLLSP